MNKETAEIEKKISSQHLEPEERKAAMATAIAAARTRVAALTPTIDQQRDAIALTARKNILQKARDEAGKAAAQVDAEVADGTRTFTDTEREQAAYEIAAAGAAEQSRISQATSQGNTNAYAQAALSPNALKAEERQIAATESAVANVAEKAAADRAMLNLKKPGDALNQAYVDTETSRTSLREEQILRQATDAAALDSFSYTDGSGRNITTRIKGMDMPNEAIDKAGEEVRKLLSGPKPQVDRAMALAEEMGKFGYGTQELRDIQHKVFGANATRTVDPSLFGGKAKEYWDIIVSKIPNATAPDFFAPSVAIHDGVSGQKLAGMNWRAQKAYFEYIFKDESIKPDKRASLIKEATEAVRNYVTDARLNKTIDADNQKVLKAFFIEPEVDPRGHFVKDGDKDWTVEVALPVDPKDPKAGNKPPETMKVSQLWEEFLKDTVKPDELKRLREDIIAKKSVSKKSEKEEDNEDTAAGA